MFSRSTFAAFCLSHMSVALMCATAEACPNCKETLAGDPNAQGLARGLYYSIIFMISMPFFIFGSLSAYFYYLVRRAQTEKLRATPGSNGSNESMPAAIG